ncbi:hypothetical protein LC593_03330 [Nostoc sp. CHAB 5844]|nr:hypothetical protein [Nostoc sp. CHAB 5844]
MWETANVQTTAISAFNDKLIVRSQYFQRATHSIVAIAPIAIKVEGLL